MSRSILYLIISLIGLLSCQQKPEKTYPLLTIHTEFGDMDMILYEETPKHKARFLDLARKQSYDSTTLHRIMPEYLIQGGDLLRKPNREFVPQLPAEIHPNLLHRRGAVGAVRKHAADNPERRSNGSQFYIVLGRKYSHEELDRLQRRHNYRLLAPKVRQLLDSGLYPALQDTAQRLQESQNVRGMVDWVLAQDSLVEKAFAPQPLLSFQERDMQLYTREGGLPERDGQYTIFGRIVSNLQALEELSKVETDGLHEPLSPVYLRISVRYIGEEEWKKLAGG